MEACSEGEDYSERRADFPRTDTQQQGSLLIAWSRYDPSRRLPCRAGVQAHASAFTLALFGCSVNRFYRCEETATCILIGSRRKGQNLIGSVLRFFGSSVLRFINLSAPRT
jgi:hypothetical protein